MIPLKTSDYLTSEFLIYHCIILNYECCKWFLLKESVKDARLITYINKIILKTIIFLFADLTVNWPIYFNRCQTFYQCRLTPQQGLFLVSWNICSHNACVMSTDIFCHPITHKHKYVCMDAYTYFSIGMGEKHKAPPGDWMSSLIHCNTILYFMGLETPLPTLSHATSHHMIF